SPSPESWLPPKRMSPRSISRRTLTATVDISARASSTARPASAIASSAGVALQAASGRTAARPRDSSFMGRFMWVLESGRKESNCVGPAWRPGSVGGDVDATAHAAVPDVAAAGAAHDQVAADVAGLEVAGAHGPDAHVAGDVVQPGIAGADGRDLHVARDALEFQVARPDAADRDAAAYAGRGHVAGAD